MCANSRPPDCISLDAHRDHDHPVERWVRRTLMVALTALAVAGLANVFGQRPHESEATSPEATLRVSAPAALRSGVMFQGRFEVAANSGIRRPTLVLEHGWFDAITVNTVEPAPVEEASGDGHIALVFDPLAPGRKLTVFVEFQANPTSVGRRSQGVEVRDGDRTLAQVDRSVIIYP